jgi:hypothetical protein
MAPTELIQRLTSAGCQVRIDGESLRVRDPEHALTDELRDAIRQHKAELLQLLRADPANDKPKPCPACGDVERWPTTRGLICPTCWLAASAPEPVPCYIKRCVTCGGTSWGPSGRRAADGAELWHCRMCAAKGR